MDGLVRTEIKEGKLFFTPSLAEEISFPSEKTLIIRLKKNVVWSNGAVLEASHFVQSWKQLLTQNGPNASLLFPIHNARNFFEKKVPFSAVGVTITDFRTIQLLFDEPQPQFPLVLSHPATFPLFSTSLLAPPVFLGQFILAAREVGKFARFLPNPKFHGAPSLLAGIEMHFPPSESRARNGLILFQEGKVDFVAPLPFSNSSKMDDESVEKNMDGIPTFSNYYLIFHTLRKPFQNVDARRAFTLAIDRNEFQTVFRWPHSLPYSLFFLSVPGKPKSWFPRFSVDAAKKEWGLGNDPNRSINRITLGWVQGPFSQDLAENLQVQWIKNLDQKVELVPPPKNQDMQTYLSQQNLILLPSRTNLLARLRGMEQWIGKAAPPFFPRVSAPAGELAFLEKVTNENYLSQLETADELLISKNFYILPLMTPSRRVLRRHTLNGLKRNALELWDVTEATLDP